MVRQPLVVARISSTQWAAMPPRSPSRLAARSRMALKAGASPRGGVPWQFRQPMSAASAEPTGVADCAGAASCACAGWNAARASKAAEKVAKAQGAVFMRP